MNTDKMNLNELEQLSGGTFLDDVKEALKRLIPNPFAPEKPSIPMRPEPIIATEAKKDPVFKSMPELG